MNRILWWPSRHLLNTVLPPTAQQEALLLLWQPPQIKSTSSMSTHKTDCFTRRKSCCHLQATSHSLQKARDACLCRWARFCSFGGHHKLVRSLHLGELSLTLPHSSNSLFQSYFDFLSTDICVCLCFAKSSPASVCSTALAIHLIYHTTCPTFSFCIRSVKWTVLIAMAWSFPLAHCDQINTMLIQLTSNFTSHLLLHVLLSSQISQFLSASTLQMWPDAWHLFYCAFSLVCLALQCPAVCRFVGL